MNMTEEIVDMLTVELQNEPEFNADILENKVKAVVRELKSRRNYSATGMTDKEIEADMENYFSVIVDVSRYDYNQRGAERELSHSDNGVSRTYESRDALWRQVHAFVKVL